MKVDIMGTRTARKITGKKPLIWVPGRKEPLTGLRPKKYRKLFIFVMRWASTPVTRVTNRRVTGKEPR